jgi:hypothetical protein
MAYNPADFELVETPTGSAPPYNPADFDLVDDGQTGLIEGVGNSIKRGWTMSQMASEMEKPAPDPQRVAALQQEMQAAPPSDEYMTVMDDRRAPEESWTAFKSAPVKVLAELMGESFSAFAGQMIEKAPNRVAIGLGAGAAMGAPVYGVGAVPGGFIGAGAGFAEASGAASYSLEMAGGVLEAMEQAGVPLDNPEALGQALQDPQRMQLAREFAQRKAVPIAIFDGASAVIGGRMFGGGKVTSAMQRLGQGMAETFTQAAMGASGEASGQLAQSGEITSGRAILAEGVAEIPTGLVEIGAGQLSQAGTNANQPAATAPAAAPAAAPQPAPFTPPPAAETVVVEEVFGDPTTAAAEPAATAAPAFDPSQPFEVVQEPSEVIVTEPAAAPKIFRGVSPDVDYSSGDQFWSESREVAENYAAQTGTEGTIDEATPETLPKNLYTATDKPTLKDELELKNEPFAPEFDAEAKAVLQARGFEGIRYESGTDLGGEQAAEFHVFGKPQPQSRVQQLKKKLAEVDPMFANPDFWKAQDARGYDDAAIANLEQTLKNFTKPKKSKGKKAAPAQANPVADIWEKYDSTGEIDSPMDLADAVDAMLVNETNPVLEDAVREYRAAIEQDFDQFGGRGEDGYTDRFVAAVQQAAQQPAPMPVQEAAAQIKKSLASGVEAFHGGSLPDEITEVRAFGGLHAGTQRAAQERVGRPSTAADTANVSRIVVKASNPYLPQGRVLDESNGTDRTQLFLIQQLPEERQKLIDAGFDVVPYRNAVEDPGSLSYLVLDPRGYTKRGDAYTKSSDTPAKRSRTRIKKMTAQSGAIDLSIVEDLVEYGKTIYRAGMSFGKWAGQMVKEFGQGIASFLKQAFDRIVQAYKDSPYSDTTGAVGDVRPNQKPRRFEQRVSQAENVSEQTRGMLGDDMYDTIGLEPMADEARAWIAENGIDAAERRVLELGNEKVAVTPLDFTIAQYLQVNLDAMGFHNRAASVARTISRRATSLGQTISMLKLFSRLSPEGIVQYAGQVMDEHINTLPPERQAQIRADQQDMVNLEETIATTRNRTAEDAIIKGEQGGEKIQDKLKRRVPDKGQKQSVNVNIRSVLTSQATKAEATKQITQLLVESGISASEAAALANAITSRFYAVLEGARKAAAQASRPKSGKGKVAFDKLMARLKNGEVSDQELLAELARMRGLPALTPAVRNRLQKLAQEVRMAPDEDVKVVAATLMFEEVHELVPADFWSKVRTFRIIMMLFSPKTWIKNLGGNQVQWFLHIGRDSFINTVVDPIVSGFSGKRTGARAKTGRVRALLTPLSDLKKGYMWNKQNNPQANFAENSAAALNHLRVLSKLTTQNKFEMADIKDVGRRMFSDPFMGALESALSIALGGPDRAYWMSAYRASIAQREAAAKANGEWTGRPSPEDVEGAQADAMAAIYQNKNSISDFGIGFRSKLNLFSMKALAKLVPGMKPTDQYGLGSMLLTFAQVPGAIARTAINWSPLGTVNAFYEGMNGILWKASRERVGKPFDQAAFNRAFTEALGGSGIYVAGYWLYAMGVITASQEEDDDLEAMRKAMGMGQFSLNMSALKRMLLSGNIWEKQQTQFGDAIYKYDWVQPIAITFAAGAELAKMVEENDRNGVKRGLAGKAGMAALSLAAGAKSLEELPLLSGLSSFMKTWGNDSLLAAVTKTVAGEPSAFVPQLVRQANQLMDNTLRQTRGGDSNVLRAFNQLAANTPGVGDKYPPRFDITGTPMERHHRSGNTVFNVLINPAVATYAKTNPVFDEVQRLMSATGETRQFPREVKRAATINGQRVDLSNEQLSAYQYYVGNYTMSTFNWRVNNPGYLRMPDAEKVKELAQDMEDIDAAVKSALFGHDVRRLTRRQRVMRANLVNSPLGQSMPPR